MTRDSSAQHSPNVPRLTCRNTLREVWYQTRTRLSNLPHRLWHHWLRILGRRRFGAPVRLVVWLGPGATVTTTKRARASLSRPTRTRRLAAKSTSHCQCRRPACTQALKDQGSVAEDSCVRSFASGGSRRRVLYLQLAGWMAADHAGGVLSFGQTLRNAQASRV
ncbi:hypothetical protein BKA70DRAFT_103085 [Coprinopsis sp. MPI-PUGE-AT-0042]|nr:hypothetical protein BKA70DRAFT_103085 [Coprinopsis sp. MPI-PUGE-AT-0042]